MLLPTHLPKLPTDLTLNCQMTNFIAKWSSYIAKTQEQFKMQIHKSLTTDKRAVSSQRYSRKIVLYFWHKPDGHLKVRSILFLLGLMVFWQYFSHITIAWVGLFTSTNRSLQVTVFFRIFTWYIQHIQTQTHGPRVQDYKLHTLPADPWAS